MGSGYRLMSWQEYYHKLALSRQLNAINRENEREERLRKIHNKYYYDSFEDWVNDVDYNPYILIGNDDW